MTQKPKAESLEGTETDLLYAENPLQSAALILDRIRICLPKCNLASICREIHLLQGKLWLHAVRRSLLGRMSDIGYEAKSGDVAGTSAYPSTPDNQPVTSSS